MVVLRLIGPSIQQLQQHKLLYYCFLSVRVVEKNCGFIIRNQKKNNEHCYADNARDYKNDWMMKEYLDNWMRYRLCQTQHAKIILCDDNNSQTQHIPLHLVHKRWTAFHSIRIPQTPRTKTQCAILLTGRWPGDPCFAMHARTTSTTECPYSCRIVDAREHSPTQWGSCGME